jgi:prephenate dehydrogenase (NADP+)
MASVMEPFLAGGEDFVIGLIGMGDMGKMYARRLSSAGWR